jgi:hypothetical protein
MNFAAIRHIETDIGYSASIKDFITACSS